MERESTEMSTSPPTPVRSPTSDDGENMFSGSSFNNAKF